MTAAPELIGQWCSLHWPFISGVALCVLSAAELVPSFISRPNSGPSRRHWVAGVALYLSNHFLLRWVSPFVLANLFAGRSSSATLPFALVQQQFGSWAVLVVGFLGMDLFSYAVHRLLHQFEVTWGWHALHHSDSEVDVITAIRHHPLEILFSGIIFSSIFVGLGAPWWLFAIFGFFEIPYSGLLHCNLRFPARVQKIFGFLFVTPDDHLVHHSTDLRHVARNYGHIFIIWDRLFGTYWAADREPKEFAFGLPEGNHKPLSRWLFPDTNLIFSYLLVVLAIGLWPRELPTSSYSEPMKTIQIQPIQVCDNNGKSCAPLQRIAQYQVTANRIFAAAGLRFEFLSVVQMRESSYLRIHIEPEPDYPTGIPTDQARRLMRQSGHMQNSNPLVLNIYFVAQLSSPEPDTLYGLGLTNANGAIVGTEGDPSWDLVAHELGHNLGLDHVEDPSNLMKHSGRNGRNELSASQISHIRQSMFVEQELWRPLRMSLDNSRWLLKSMDGHGDVLRSLKVRFLSQEDHLQESFTGTHCLTKTSLRKFASGGSELEMQFSRPCLENEKPELALHFSGPYKDILSFQLDFQNGRFSSFDSRLFLRDELLTSSWK